MGYYIPATPQSLALKIVVDIDWEKHLTPRTIMLLKGAGLFLDYQLLAGAGRLAGIKFPLANPRATFSSGYTWSRISPYLIPVVLGIVAFQHGATPDKLLGVDQTGRASIMQGMIDRQISRLG